MKALSIRDVSIAQLVSPYYNTLPKKSSYENQEPVSVSTTGVDIFDAPYTVLHRGIFVQAPKTVKVSI